MHVQLLRLALLRLQQLRVPGRARLEVWVLRQLVLGLLLRRLLLQVPVHVMLVQQLCVLGLEVLGLLRRQLLLLH